MGVIAIIGAGELGSRHLQGMRLARSVQSVHVIDPSPKSLDVARKRWAEIAAEAPGIDVVFHSSLDGLPGAVDLAIVATNSDVRADVVRNLLDSGKTGALLLEKILFYELEEYDLIGKAIAEKSIPAWVNCHMRSRPFFKTIKNELAGKNDLRIDVSGIRWGMITAGIHFVDLLSFLSDESELKVDSFNLHGVYESKRKGFFDAYGKCYVSTASGAGLSMESAEGDDLLMSLRISSGRKTWSLVDWDGPVPCEFRNNGRLMHVNEVNIERHSSFTGLLVDEILETGSCDLPRYDFSAKEHVVFLSVFYSAYARFIGGSSGVCPVT